MPRTSGAAPANAVDVLLDEHFDNARMERIYPNAKKGGEGWVKMHDFACVLQGKQV